MKRSPLKPPSLAQVVAWRSKPRKPIARVGRRKKRERPAEAAFRTAVKERAEGWCEVNRRSVTPLSKPSKPWLDYDEEREICGTGLLHVGAHAHHVWPEDRDRGRHDPQRALYVCARAHEWIHQHPARAAELGLLRPS